MVAAVGSPLIYYPSQNKTETQLMVEVESLLMTTVPKDYFYDPEIIKNLLKGYDAKELELILQDFNDIELSTFSNAVKEKNYVVTAGGPSAGKSTILSKYIKDKGYAFIDPDEGSLRGMKRTYLTDIDKNKDPIECYNKWRNASNFIANVLLAKAFKEGYAIAHGSTMTSPNAKNELIAAQNFGYHRTILHVSCPDDVRLFAEKTRRAKDIKDDVLPYHVTDEDLVKKGKDFYAKLSDYLNNSDKILFYYRPDISTTSHAATFEAKKLKIHEIADFFGIGVLHNNAMEDPNYWNITLKLL